MAKKQKEQASENPAELYWYTSQSSPSLLLELQRRVIDGQNDLSDRKFRLLIVSCARRIDSLFPNDHCRRYVVLAEAFADGLIPADEFRAAYDASQEEAFQGTEDATDRPYNEAWSWYAAANAAQWLLFPNPGRTIVPEMKSAAGWAADALSDRRLLNNPATIPECQRLEAEAEREQVQLIRDIFGNPFRPATFSPSWRTDTVTAIARQMYESRDFGAMPILADALQDAGCDNADILNHCRDEKQVHVRGCWVVDLVLGKE